jgi:acetate kinase
MKILVANLGSTSFKYRLFDMQQERQLARGGVERIGEPESRSLVEIDGVSHESVESVPDHAVAVRRCLVQLTDPELGCLQDTSEVSAIGLKAVHGGRFSGAQRVTPEVLRAMEEMNPIAPAHNPPYIAAMRLLGERLPEIPLVAVFETGFHSTMPDRNRYYAVPRTWADQYGIARWGFHGASHGYIAARMAEILQRDDLRVISCHLGGSSSLCASRGGKSLATSMGMSPQSGLPQNNRVGDFDPFALPLVMEKTGKSLNEVLDMLAGESGLLGLSELSSDLRDIRAAADEGNKSARLALEVYVGAIRHYLGAYLVELGGADAIVFTGGIGENGADLRSQICVDLEELGIVLDTTENAAAQGEVQINATSSRTQIWVVPTNEEIVVARKTVEVLEGNR